MVWDTKLNKAVNTVERKELKWARDVQYVKDRKDIMKLRLYQ